MRKERPRDICERTFEFGVDIVEFCLTLDSSPGVRRTLSSQLLRSGTSIGANVEETQAGQSRPDFISKMNIALKESRETLYWLRLISASNLQHSPELDFLRHEAHELVSTLTVIVSNARRNS